MAVGILEYKKERMKKIRVEIRRCKNTLQRTGDYRDLQWLRGKIDGLNEAIEIIKE